MKKIFLIILFLITSIYSYSNAKRICKVKYKTEQGWSKYYTLEVQFVTGTELNKMTESYKYSTYLNYCLIWFDNGGVAILEINDVLLVGDSFDLEDFRETFKFRTDLDCKQVNGESKRNWKIEAKDGINFIDPRENDNNP